MGFICKVFLYVLSVMWIVAGTLMIFAPEMLRKKVFVKIKNMPIKKMGIIPLIFGIFIIISAQFNRHTFFVVILGIIGIAKGIVSIAATDKAMKWFDKWTNAGMNAYRITGVIAIIIGSIVLMGV